MPTRAPPRCAVARRALINLRVGTDAATGAIVASISRQPPYYLDWPRDGTFFNVALDVSGQTALAERRADLYVAWQRAPACRRRRSSTSRRRVDPDTGAASTYPADGWEMNYYPDGMVGGPIRFEIDNAALALWTIVSAGRLDARRPERLSDAALGRDRARRRICWRAGATRPPACRRRPVRTTTRRTRRRCTVPSPSSARSMSPARAARLLQRDADAAARWEARACELRNAIGQQLYDAAAQRFVATPGEHFDPATRADRRDRLAGVADARPAVGRCAHQPAACRRPRHSSARRCAWRTTAAPTS